MGRKRCSAVLEDSRQESRLKGDKPNFDNTKIIKQTASQDESEDVLHGLDPEQIDSDDDLSKLDDLLRQDPDISNYISSISPLSEARKEISHIITYFYRTSIIIKSPVSIDRVEKMESINVSQFEPFDIDHIRNKYQLDDKHQYLIERLGKANTKRRQLLKYHEKHHDRMVGRRVTIDHAPSTGGGQSQTDPQVQPENEHEQADYYSEAPSSMYTDVTVVYQDHFNQFANAQIID
ncbi:Similar to hypothetical protein FG11061.1 [Gibberella zeae PH-1]; acc. no. XP_391237 [Pyronema omphalodes CBS 100304]|uniref:Uncharacterized protein n=1 Tax=Pyronema omphalodes (strain CBS 100304) TaxID=1076935 RepID=U4LQB6_PYROM|nr:Similar to hypothetical protein FG11061.1 [Gibberella zeae PH-1]; acc. no. XP_391237 [Pyronema omphalodes CBS 100304]